MPNDYYNVSNDFVPGTKVRSADHDIEYAAIEAGFDKLAGANELNTGSIVHGDESGAADAYVSDNGGTDTYVTGQQVTFIPTNTNTGATTFTLNGGTAESILRNDGTTLQAGDLIAGVPVLMIWDGTNWVLVGATAQQTLEDSRPGISTETGTSYTVTATDETKVILFTSASAIAVTLPSDSTEDMAIGFITHIHQNGLGKITLLPDSGVTLLYATSLKTRTQNSSLSVIKTAANTYKVVGDQE